MKIGIVVDNELNSDIRVLREIGILKEQGFEIFVLCFGFLRKYHDPIYQVNITRINIPRKIRDILFLLLNTIPLYEWLWTIKIKKFILHNGLESLHVHDLYMARAAYNGIKAANSKIPMILDLHENYPFTVTTYNWTKGFWRSFISKPEDWKKKEREYLGYADRIVVLSNDFRDTLLERYPELGSENLVVLPNVPDLSQPEYQNIGVVMNPFKQELPILFYYGVIAERRGIFDALEVFINLVKEGYPVNFLLIGPVDKKDMPLFSRLTGLDLLSDRIHYIPWIESKEFPSYLGISDICLAPFHKNPQHESGVANKVYDYMLGGKPVIASNCKPQQNLIEKYNCGLIFENITEFHDAIVSLLNDKLLREKMGENGKKAIMREYNTGIVKKNLILLYKTFFLSLSILMLVIILSSCEKKNHPPTIVDQTFSVDESSIAGSMVGQVFASDEARQVVSYSMKSGNTKNAYSISELDGEITINNEEAIDFETNPDFILLIGNSYDSGDGSNNHFNGMLDELRIYNWELSKEEIRTLFKE